MVDTVASYAGLRTYTVGAVDGVIRPLLNGKFVYQMSTLDQGFWPDGNCRAHTFSIRRASLSLN